MLWCVLDSNLPSVGIAIDRIIRYHTNMMKRSPAREREHQLLVRLAAVVRADEGADILSDEDDPRLLGYAADLIKDPLSRPDKERMKAFMDTCRAAVEAFEFPPPDQALDFIQERWRSPWHLDCQKMRKEFQSHL